MYKSCSKGKIAGFLYERKSLQKVETEDGQPFVEPYQKGLYTSNIHCFHYILKVYAVILISAFCLVSSHWGPCYACLHVEF